MDLEAQAILARCTRIAEEFYRFEDDFKEITDLILNSNETKEAVKQTILKTGRRFFLFKYPSDEFLVKGTISFVPDPKDNDLLIFLRGGNRIYGLMHPAHELTCMRNYTVLATTYRGGISEGQDEFGGKEVNDVQNLINYFPKIQARLNISCQPKNTYMLGGSRGGMQMFLALGRNKELQYKIKKAAALTALLDLDVFIAFREEIKNMVINDFGFIPGINEKEWILSRNPIAIVPKIRKDLPFLILQGKSDNRISLDEGYNMVKKLKENGNPVTYMEFPEGNHFLTNQDNLKEIIADWFES